MSSSSDNFLFNEEGGDTTPQPDSEHSSSESEANAARALFHQNRRTDGENSNTMLKAFRRTDGEHHDSWLNGPPKQGAGSDSD